jgi:hypothetical protein
MIGCRRCRETGWVCEAHPHKAWSGPSACRCGAARMPCPQCCVDADWNAIPSRVPDVSAVIKSVTHAAGKKVN